MLLFFEPLIVAKKNVMLLESPLPLSLHLMLIYERLMQRKTEFFAALQHLVGVKEDNKNVKKCFLVLH